MCRFSKTEKSTESLHPTTQSRGRVLPIQKLTQKRLYLEAKKIEIERNGQQF